MYRKALLVAGLVAVGLFSFNAQEVQADHYYYPRASAYYGNYTAYSIPYPALPYVPYYRAAVPPGPYFVPYQAYYGYGTFNPAFNNSVRFYNNPYFSYGGYPTFRAY